MEKAFAWTEGLNGINSSDSCMIKSDVVIFLILHCLIANLLQNSYEAWIPLLFKVLPCWANSSKETPVLSPLVPVSLLGSSKGEDQKQKVVTKQVKVQAVLKAIKHV